MTSMHVTHLQGHHRLAHIRWVGRRKALCQDSNRGTPVIPCRSRDTAFCDRRLLGLHGKRGV